MLKLICIASLIIVSVSCEIVPMEPVYYSPIIVPIYYSPNRYYAPYNYYGSRVHYGIHDCRH